MDEAHIFECLRHVPMCAGPGDGRIACSDAFVFLLVMVPGVARRFFFVTRALQLARSSATTVFLMSG